MTKLIQEGTEFISIEPGQDNDDNSGDVGNWLADLFENFF